MERTLVIIKPDNFWKQSSRPGNIIDIFSRTGLYIIGAKVLRMSVAQAEEFYSPLRAIFVEKLKGQLQKKLHGALRTVLGFDVLEETSGKIAELLNERNAEHEFRKIVNYMTGRDSPEEKSLGEKGKCLALLYQGEDAIQKVRDRLGATNPEAAVPGTVRSIYGYDLMRNGAHASDSPENSERERRIIGLWEETDTPDFAKVIDNYLEGQP